MKTYTIGTSWKRLLAVSAVLSTMLAVYSGVTAASSAAPAPPKPLVASETARPQPAYCKPGRTCSTAAPDAKQEPALSAPIALPAKRKGALNTPSLHEYGPPSSINGQ